jgi:hypothetical protein
MVVSLCHGITAAEPSDSFPIGFDDFLVKRRVFQLEPTDQGRTEIETEGGIIVDEIEDLSFTIDDTGVGIWPITLEGDPFVPVMERMSALLGLDGFKPWILPRRLVEVAVNGYKCVFHLF